MPSRRRSRSTDANWWAWSLRRCWTGRRRLAGSSSTSDPIARSRPAGSGSGSGGGGRGGVGLGLHLQRGAPGEGPLAADAAALALAQATPDAELLAVAEGVLEA